MENGGFPQDAFVGGEVERTKHIFVARAKHDNGLQPCQLKEGHCGAQMPYGGEGKNMPNYEVLANSSDLHWKSIIVGGLPADALKTGEEANGSALYTVKYVVSGTKYIGKYNGFDKAYFVIDGKEKEILSGELKILCFREFMQKEKVSMKASSSSPIFYFRYGN